MYAHTHLQTMTMAPTTTIAPAGSLFELMSDFQWDHEKFDLPMFDTSKSPSRCGPLTIAKDCSELFAVNTEDCFDPESSSMLLHPEVVLHSEFADLPDELPLPLSEELQFFLDTSVLGDAEVPQQQQPQAEAEETPSTSAEGIKTETKVEPQESSSYDSDSQMMDDEDEQEHDEQQDVKPDAESLSKMTSSLPESDDPLDKHIYSMFPMEILRLERSSFNKWKKTNRTRKLKPDETKRLAKIRRTVLARVYAERARQRRDADHKGTKAECNSLRAENARLKALVAKLEKQRR